MNAAMEIRPVHGAAPAGQSRQNLLCRMPIAVRAYADTGGLRPQGVQKGMIVYTADGLLGKVVYTSATYSRVISLIHDKSGVSAMVERGYVSGYNDGRLNPKGQITRAEMAQIMCNIFQSVHDSGEITGSYQSTVLVGNCGRY